MTLKITKGIYKEGNCTTQNIEEIGEFDEIDPTTDSKKQILADLKESLRQLESGQTLPLSKLWD